MQWVLRLGHRILSSRMRNNIVTKLVEWTSMWTLAWQKPPLPWWGRHIFVWICTANNETNAETETPQALFNGQRTEKRVLSSQIDFSPPFRLRHRRGRRLQVKGRELNKEKEEYSWFIWEQIGTIPLLSPCMGASGISMAIVKCPVTDGCFI